MNIDNLEFNFIHNRFFLASFHMANGNQIEIGILSLNAGTLSYTDISNIDYAWSLSCSIRKHISPTNN